MVQSRIARRETYGVSRSGNGCAESARLKLRQATLSFGARASQPERTNIVLCRSEKVIVKCVSQLRSLAAAPLQAGIRRLQAKFAISRESKKPSWRGVCRGRNVAFVVGIKYA
jgi:hypothetical protein